MFCIYVVALVALANTNHQHLDSLRLSPDSLRSKRNLFGRDAGGGSSNAANQDDKDKGESM